MWWIIGQELILHNKYIKLTTDTYWMHEEFQRQKSNDAFRFWHPYSISYLWILGRLDNFQKLLYLLTSVICVVVWQFLGWNLFCKINQNTGSVSCFGFTFQRAQALERPKNRIRNWNINQTKHRSVRSSIILLISV